MLNSSRRGRNGLTLIELVFSIGLVVLLAGLSLYSLSPGKGKVSTIALATALTDEFRAARQLAISSGHPVALGIPVSGSGGADSIFRLEGWNKPSVTWSNGYGGDYPSIAFGAASWSGAPGVVKSGLDGPLLSKMSLFQFENDWLPDLYKSDSIFCFTPDGGLITNGQPALDGRYTVVVAEHPIISGHTITAGTEAVTIYISPTGSIDYKKGTPGTILPAATNPVPPAPIMARDPENPNASIRLSEIRVLPTADDVGIDAFCTPGQQVTLELYAYDVSGKALFTQWNQVGPNNVVGTFTSPRSFTGPLQSETDRMEYVQEAPENLVWYGGPAPTGGCFRSRWSWTVPLESLPGDVYEIEADVRDAKGETAIENPPKITLPTAPAGRLIVELEIAGRHQLVRMNPDGSGRVVLTEQKVDERMPSVDASGTIIAYLQGPEGDPTQRFIKVARLPDKDSEETIAGPGHFTSVSLSPDGNWISYRDQVAGELHFKNLSELSQSTLPTFSKPQTWSGSYSGATEPDDPVTAPPAVVNPANKSRTGWDFRGDQQYALWGNGNTLVRTDLNNPGAGETTIHSHSTESLFAPTSFSPKGDSASYLTFTVGSLDPYIAVAPLNASGTSTGTPLKVDLDSANIDDDLPSISGTGEQMIIPRRDADGTRSAIILPWDSQAKNYRNTTPIMVQQEVYSAVWLP